MSKPKDKTYVVLGTVTMQIDLRIPADSPEHAKAIVLEEMGIQNTDECDVDLRVSLDPN